MKDRQQKARRPNPQPKPKKDGQKPQTGTEPTASSRGQKRIALVAGIAGLLVGVALFLYFSQGDSQNAKTSQPKRVSIAGSEGYINPGVCADCHLDVWETYQKTGMGRAFAPMGPETIDPAFTGDNTFYHKASDQHFTMFTRDGKYYQRRHQLDAQGRETNVLEKEIQFVMGSGNHVRTYLHRTPEGRVFELPVSWYSENGGFWAMSPGYDRPDHGGFRRQINYQCMGCHNGYPEIEEGGDLSGTMPVLPETLPAGVDCQRCHGPGRAHVEMAQSSEPPLDKIRQTIVNPARLSRERQLDVCMQCHLETTSFQLPQGIVKYERGIFSYRPGEPLSDYMLHFDHPAGSGPEDKFEIAHAAYRLRMSECFQQSSELVCTTCHNPHDIPRGEEATKHYTAVCLNCHNAELQNLAAASRHTSSQECVQCHMPKRRTDDVVHAVMTDHFIQRNKPARDLLAPLEERRETNETAYKGEVASYPVSKEPAADSDLYLAVAQVRQGANLQKGIPRLEEALRTRNPEQGEFYFELAEAYSKTNESAKAIAAYREAVARSPEFWPAIHKLGLALGNAGMVEEARQTLRRASELRPDDPAVLNDLAVLDLREGRVAEASGELQRALQIDPDLSEGHRNLGLARLRLGDRVQGEASLREAIRLDPTFAAAYKDLADLLAQDNAEQAQLYYQKAVALDPTNASMVYDFALFLVRQERYSEAERNFEAAAKLEPSHARAITGLADVATLRGEVDAAIQQYKRALRIDPELRAAHLGLGFALAFQGQPEAAIEHFQIAARSPDPAIQQAALEALQAGSAPLPNR